MNLSANHIRAALIKIAENNARPYYDVVVQRDVINAVRYGSYHPLKAQVFSVKVELKHALSTYEIRINAIKEITKQYGMTANLARAADVDVVCLSHILCGDRDLTEALWSKIELGIKHINENLEKYQKNYKHKTCGTVCRYKYKGCRCTACVEAFKRHEALRKAAA